MNSIGIVGAGASGLIAAIECAKNGADVTLFEKKDRVGKKILVTGNGRCNFTNENMSKDFYYCEDDDFVEAVLDKFSNKDLCLYFTELGLLIKNKNGYYYPQSEQASAVLDKLRFACVENNVKIKTDLEIKAVTKKGEGFIVKDNAGNTYSFDKVILACGGKASLSKNEKTNGYELCKSLGLSVTKLYPALTQIICEGANFKALSGVRSDCALYVFVNNELCMTQQGEVLFNDSGISGIVSFQVSHYVAKCLDENKKVQIVLDLLPGVSEASLKQFIASLSLLHEKQTIEEVFIGIHNKKLGMEIIKACGLKPGMGVLEASIDSLTEASMLFKEFVINPVSVNGFEHSQVTGGGVKTDELGYNLECKKVPGLYVTGELIDVDGVCGGYNLQWAFSTGVIAARAASM